MHTRRRTAHGSTSCAYLWRSRTRADGAGDGAGPALRLVVEHALGVVAGAEEWLDHDRRLDDGLRVVTDTHRRAPEVLRNEPVPHGRFDLLDAVVVVLELDVPAVPRAD